MEQDVLARFEKIAQAMPCEYEHVIKGKLIRDNPSRETCDCPGCKFRRAIARVKSNTAIPTINHRTWHGKGQNRNVHPY